MINSHTASRTIVRLLVAVVLALSLIVAVTVHAAAVGDSGKLVPCGTKIEVKPGSDCPSGSCICYVGECSACHLQVLAERIIALLVSIGVIVAALIFVNAGVLYVSASAKPGNIARAHKMFTSALTGLVLLLAAWLLIDVVMKALYADKDTGWGPWNAILCKGAKDMHCIDRIKQVSYEGEWQPHAAGPGYNSSDFVKDPTTGMPILSSDAALRGAENLKTNCSVGGMSCYDYIVQQATAAGVDPQFALALATIESGGCKDPTSCVSGAGAVGVLQLMPATARGLCGAPCANMSNAQMTEYLKDPANNIALGVKYMDSAFSDSRVISLAGGDLEKQQAYAAAYYNGGPRALNSSSSCPGQTWYECGVNTGYAETRSYVTKMQQIVGGN